MYIKNGLVFVKGMIKLLKEYSKMEDSIAPDEFISEKLKKTKSDQQLSELSENFLLLMKHEKFFEIMVPNFWNYYGLKPFNKEIITTLMFVIIFGLNEENVGKVVDMFTQFKYQFSDNILEYFTIENNLVDATQAGCRVFENDYVLERILHPLLDNINLIQDVLLQVRKYIAEQYEITVKPVTKPVAPSCAEKVVRNPAPPLNTPAVATLFKSSEVPKVVLEGDFKFQEGLEKAYEANKAKAAKLLQFSREKAFKCATVAPKPPPPPPALPTCKFTSKVIPPKKDVTIKRNAASLMREAATLVKDRENEMKKLEALTQAIFDPTALESLEEQIRESKEQEHLQEIERKHLQGQLTYEEAILAKQNWLLLNKQKMEEFKQERLEILEEIELWREKEQEKMKAQVEKSRSIEQAVKEAEKKLYMNKRLQAQMVENETKQLLKEAYEKRQEELACKVKLIQELRALQQVRSLDVKEFDPTESPNFGLLCEMSIAELQERLGLLQIELQEELERRRQSIVERREKQQQLIESVKVFICQNRVSKPKPLPRAPVKLEQTPDLAALRERLLRARESRTNNQHSGVF